MDLYAGVDIVLASALVIKDGSVLVLHRVDHDHYETPGGKLSLSDCTDPEHPTVADLLTCAMRELEEEVDCTAEPIGEPIEHRFTLRDGRRAYVAKFPMRLISGSCTVREQVFDEARFVPIGELRSLRLSPDLFELLDELEALIGTIEP
jgi:8-oxo-dGTP pyrophosphatase MutT (NUDIX family)